VGRDYRLIIDRSEFLDLIENLKKATSFSIDLETTSPYPMWAHLVGSACPMLRIKPSTFPLATKIGRQEGNSPPLGIGTVKTDLGGRWNEEGGSEHQI